MSLPTIVGNTYNSKNEIIGDNYKLCRDILHNFNDTPHFMIHMTNQAESIYRQYLEQNKLKREYDSGIDLLCPNELIIRANSTVLIDLGIIVECNIITKNYDTNELIYNHRPYILAPRSSIYKLHGIQVANSIGIIDAGYRGILKLALRNLNDCDYLIKKGERLSQICLPSLDYNYMFSIVNIEDGLISETERGEGGLGSTG